MANKLNHNLNYFCELLVLWTKTVSYADEGNLADRKFGNKI